METLEQQLVPITKRKVIIRNCALFTDCISKKKNNTQVGNAEVIDVAISI